MPNSFSQKKDISALTIGASILPDTFDPDNFSQVNPWKNPMNWDMQVQLFDTLFEYDTKIMNNSKVQDTTKLLPVLAESITSSNDGYTHKIKLKENIISEYGNELTADDIFWSWQATKASSNMPHPPSTHWLDTKDPGEVGRWIALTGSAPVDTNPVSVLEKYVIEFKLREPSFAFQHILTMVLPPVYDATEAKKHSNKKDPFARKWLQRHSCGFSPYSILDISHEQVILQSRDNYSRINPQIKKIIYKLINHSERITQLQNNQIDILTGLSPLENEAFKKNAEIEVFEAFGNQQLSLQMDMKKYPFDDLSFRKALMYLMPYDEIINNEFIGHARAWNGVVSSINPAYEELFTGKTDIKLAKQLLSQSTYDGRKIELAYIEQSLIHKNIVTSISKQAKDINIQIVPQAISSQKMSDLQKKFQVPFAIAGGGHRCAEMSYAMPHDFGDKIYGITNWVDYNNDELNQLIEKIKFSRDNEERVNLIKKSHKIVAQDLPWIFIAQPNYSIAYKAGLKNISWRSRASGPQSYASLFWEN